ncbi:MAG: right-handed parallel beta-helix repeat-containing protein [Chloroflexi bacterium]|nr:right-handed parallel beta-helix repeat-containing protein [Chloroflexota bacterium]
MFKQQFRPRTVLLNYLLCLALLLPSFNPSLVQAATLDTTVLYIAASNTIVLGSAAGLPASEPITVPELSAKLIGQNLPNLLLDQGNGIWLLKANILINPTAQLSVVDPVKELRLESIPGNFVNINAYRGGYLLINTIKVTSWDSAGNVVDQNTADGRAYLGAQEGGRMDIVNSEIAYLGWGANEVSGLSWRKRLTSADAATGATGTVQGSNIHDNYYGLFASGAYGLKILSNQVHNSLGYGISARDDSEAMEIAGNDVFANANNGIIIGRQSQNNQVHDNQVHDHTQDGIVVEQSATANLISNNNAYNNRNGIVLSQASANQVQTNQLHNNITGITLEAKYNASASIDNITTANQVVSNTIDSNTSYGIYLYARADRNTLAGNTVTQSGINGIYIKSGGNLLNKNTVSNGVAGIVILGGENEQLPLGAVPALELGGQNNIVINSIITANSDTGIRIMGGVNNRIGATLQAAPAENGNQIQGNGKDGIAIVMASAGTASTDNQVLNNTIHTNGARGIYLSDITTLRNRLSQNSITGNVSSGIKVDGGAQQGIQPPVITSVLADGHVNGTAQPNATIEVYVDPTGEGQTFLGATTADGAGAWSFLLPSPQNQKQLTALAIDASGNTSAFSGSSGTTAGALYHVINDEHGQKTIQVTGAGSVVTLPAIMTGLGLSNTTGSNVKLLDDLGNGIWQLNGNLFIGDSVTLSVTAQSGVNELRLRSAAGVATANAQAAVVAANALQQLSADTTTSDATADDIATAEISSTIAYTSFAYLRTHGGTINLDGVKVYSWDPATNSSDLDINNGRAYIVAKYESTLNISNSELSYLGSADTDSQGVTWRDVNDSASPAVLRTRVTGTVLNSNFHHNYYGAYTSQASNMTFRGNQFHDNLRYGFTLRDNTNSVLVESNEAFANGSHGFFISHGSNGNTFHANKAHDNLDPGTSLAHGFVLDPGSANSQQLPSLDNVLDGNEAYNNEGYGLRLQSANNNQVLNNLFHDNQQGISIDQTSTGNTLSGNTLHKNLINGVIVSETADGNTLTNNTATENGNNGIYLRANNNIVNGNTASNNTKAGIGLLLAVGVPVLQNNQLISNTVSGNLDNGVDLRGATHTLIQGNIIENSGAQGIYLTDGASQTTIANNIVRLNNAYGIRANGVTTVANTWSANQIYGNQTGGVSLSQNANGNLLAPQLTSVVARVVSGKTTKPGATVEIFTDAGSQGNYFEGQTTASGDGSFTFTLPDTSVWRAGKITAIIIDSQGNASPFSGAITAPVVTVVVPTPTPLPTDPGGTNFDDSLYLPLIRR